MEHFDQLLQDVRSLMFEIVNAKTPSVDFELATIDLITCVTSFSIAKWSELAPQDPTLGILFLTVQLKCLHLLEQKGWNVRPEPIEGSNQL